ncbi:MAG: hypothetical protein KDA24_03575 [Deltaproteobacteria bacterium]|nr:hypothetical protein [Deltaproteobacteria bacterium]
MSPETRMWRGDRRRPSPQPFRILLILLLLVVWGPEARAEEPLETPDPSRLPRLLDEAASLKDAGACEEALTVYEELIAWSASWVGQDFWVHSTAHYDAAICAESLGAPDKARSHYDAIVALNDRLPPQLLSDTLFRRALLDVIPGAPTRAARKDLMRVRRLERAALPRALVDLQLARLDSLDRRPRAALRRLLVAGTALDSAGDDADRDRRGAPLDWYRAEASLVRGTLWSARAAAITLKLRPQRTVVDRIEARASALAQVEAHYAVAAGYPQPWAPRALHDLGLAWLAASEALSGLLAEARAHLEKKNDPAVTALVTWLEPRIPAQFRKAAESWQLCVESSRVLGMAPGVSAQCQSLLDSLLTRPELSPTMSR